MFYYDTSGVIDFIYSTTTYGFLWYTTLLCLLKKTMCGKQPNENIELELENALFDTTHENNIQT